jgi:hypothetical protein
MCGMTIVKTPTVGATQAAASMAPVPIARPRRRGQAPQPRSGALKAQGLTVAVAVAAPSKGPSVAQYNGNFLEAIDPIGISASSPIYTSLTDVTEP